MKKKTRNIEVNGTKYVWVVNGYSDGNSLTVYRGSTKIIYTAINSITITPKLVRGYICEFEYSMSGVRQ